MPTPTSTYRVSICEACIYYHHYGEWPETDDATERMAEHDRLWGPNYSLSIDDENTDEGPEPHFSYNDCQGCGNRLGGERYDATFTEWETTK